MVSQHDEMRKHAVSLVHKCLQAESVNAALQDKALTGAAGVGDARTLRGELAPLLADPSFRSAWEKGFPTDPDPTKKLLIGFADLSRAADGPATATSMS